MIEIYEGRIGGGKTYSAIKRAVKYIASGGCVCTNIDLQVEEIREYVKRRYSWTLQEGQIIKLKDEEIRLFHQFTPSGTPEKPSLVIIDEAHIYMNSRDWKDQQKELLIFLTQSRKTNTDIIFITQAITNIDKQIRVLEQYIWRFTDLSKFVIPGLGIKYPFNHILQCKFDYDGKTLISRNFVTKNKKLFKLYNTYQLIRSFPRLEAKTKFDKVKVKKEKLSMIKVILLIVLVMIPVTVFSFKKFGKSPIATTEKTEFVKKDLQKAKKFNIIPVYIKGRYLTSKGFVMMTDNFTFKKGRYSPYGMVKHITYDSIYIEDENGKKYILIDTNTIQKADIVKPVRSQTVKTSQKAGIPFNY